MALLAAPGEPFSKIETTRQECKRPLECVMDLMPARDPLVIEIVWLRSKSKRQGGMLHP